MQYAPITALLVEAVREQQKQISNQNEQIKSYKSENDNLKSQLQSIQEKVDKIEILMAESRGN
jgi:peptidoglycan hydrolase CwlO-like protein